MAEYQIVNKNANDNISILEYKKKIVLKSIRELNKLELEVAELEASK